MAVFPSRWEPFGIVCLEALAMGCPVVVTKGTGLEEVMGLALSEFAVPVTEDIRPLKQKILDLMRKKDTQSLSEKLRRRALDVVHQAETGWLDLLRDLDRKDQIEDSTAASIIDPLQRLLFSLDDQWCGVSFLQVYFCRRGRYVEADSLRVPYSRNRWLTLKIPMPFGTGDRYLRLDPADGASVTRIREIALHHEGGGEIWRADGGNEFQGCRVVGEATGAVRDGCLVVTAPAADPQILINCPVTDRPAEMRVVLFSSDK